MRSVGPATLESPSKVMDGVTDPLQPMLADLRQTFNKKIPGGLTETADKRLQRTLHHYVKEVERVQGSTSDQVQDILRMTYDSMAAWFRRNLTAAVASAKNTATATATEERFETEMDPMTVFANIKAARSGSAPSSVPSPAPFRMPDLEKLDAKTREFPAPTPYVQQKDVVQPQQDVVKYREVEYNLVMNSKDRDWLANTTQNRYNFNIQFNTNYRPQGFGLQGNIQNRLRNITRIEFVKAILPVEGLTVVVPRSCSEGGATSPETAFYSALALPSVNVLVDEFQGNNFGTNNAIDKSLAVCQYDATWRSDTIHNKPSANRGYSLFIPKFMKAQRVYSPTPLSNLQTLSFRLQDPENNLLSDTPDSSAIGTIAFSADISGSCYSDAAGGSSNYIFINTKTWFPVWAYSQLDRVLLQGITFKSGSQPEGGQVLVDWLQQTAGLSVIGVAHTDSSALTHVADGPNSVGYANWIIVRNRFENPTDGSISLDYFTGSSVGDLALASDLVTFSVDYEKGGILNLSRQVQLTIRIITREYDLTSNVRADNV
jgi:hypothetical protein